MERELRRGLMAVWRESVAARTPMPAELALAERLGVSRPSVREELIRMEAEGLPRRGVGRGTFPNPLALDAVLRLDQPRELAEVLDEAGLSPRVELRSARWGVLDATEAERLERLPGERCLRTEKIWHADGRPWMRAVDVVPSNHEAAEPVGVESVYELVERLRGVPVQWERVAVRPVAAGSADAAALEVAVGSPLLEVSILGASRHGEALYLATEAHRLDERGYTLLRQVPEP